MVKKFPVISKKGYEYLARIDEIGNILDEDVVRVRLFKVTKTTGFLGKQKETLTRIYASYYDDSDKEFFNYILAVKKTVEYYEKSPAFLKWENEENNIEQLEEWDGVC